MLANRAFSPAIYIPTIHHEELFTSYVTRAFKCSGYAVEKDFAERTLGTEKAVSLDRHDGNESYCRQLRIRLDKLGMTFEQGINEEHCLAALGSPFYRDSIRPYNYKTETIGTGYVFTSASGMQRTIIRPHYSFCLMCTLDDIEKIGFSYWRRAHRLAGVQVCARHRCELLDACPRCGERWTVDQAPNDRCRKCDYRYQTTCIDHSSIQQAAKRRFAEAVDGVLQGRIKGPLDPRRVMQRFRRIYPNNSKVDGRDLADHILSVAGAEFVDELGLNLSPAVPQHWTAAFHAKRAILAEASPHLLVYACISHDHPREDLFLTECPSDPRWTVSPDLNECREAMWKESGNVTDQLEMSNLSGPR